MFGDLIAAPSNSEIYNVLRKNNSLKVLAILDIHNQLVEVYPQVGAFGATFPSPGDLRLESEVVVIATMSPFGICLFPKVTYTRYSTDEVLEKLYNFYLSTQVNNEKPWLEKVGSQSKLKNILGNIRRRTDSIEEGKREKKMK